MVPKLRFPEFQGSEGWKEVSLQKLARPVADRAAAGDADNVLSLSAEQGLVLQSDYFGKKIAGDSIDRYLKIRRDDFVYNDRTTKASSFGTIKRLSNYSDGIVSPIYKCFRFHPSENPVFWGWYFESGSHDPALGGLVNEGARAGRFNISVTKFLSTNVCRPDEAEQKKIADCLDSVDALIAMQGQKVEALRAHKKGLMQQLFPQEGETQPRLRFPEFEGTGPWREETLNHLCARIMDGTHFSPKTKEGPRPYLTSKNIKDGRIDLSSLTYISEEEHAEIFKRCPVKLNDVLLTKDGANTGNCALNNLDFEFSLLSSVAVLRGNPRYLLQSFLFQSILSDRIQALIAEAMSGQAITRITLAKIGGFSIPVTSLAEQQRIADCLTSLDSVILGENQKFDKLRTHKKGLMQQLFPSVKEGDA